MEQKEYWDGASDTKEFTTPFQIDEFTKYVRQNAIILDVGCGYGRTLATLHQFGYSKLIGIDFAKKMIERGQTQFPYLDLRVKEDAQIDFPSESVDAVILFAVLTCVCKNADQIELIKEISRILKPDGVLYVNDFLLNTDTRNLQRYQRFSNDYEEYGTFELPEGAVCRHHDKNWIHALLSGFSQKEFEHLTFTTMNGNKSNGFYFIGSKL